MKRTVVAVGALMFGVGAVMAQQNLVKQNQDIMKANARNLGGVLIAMVKGEKPYDQVAVNAALAQLDETAKKLPTMFPDSIKGAKSDSDYSASPKIWEDKAGFQARIDGFAKVITEAKAKIKDIDTLKASAPAIGKECGNCHETFRVKNS
jgi:cytochrome c556